MRTWGREYELAITFDGRRIVITNPFKIAFVCDESTESEGNEMTVSVWGLSRQNRISLTRDEDTKGHVGVELKVGYRGNVPLLFKGSLTKGSFERTGADFITTLKCVDGGDDIQYAYTSACVTSKEGAISTCMGDFKTVGAGAVTSQQQLVRPKVLVGNSSILMRDMIDKDQEFFITNEQAFILGKNEARKGYAQVVSAETGLINIPQSSKNEIEFDTMMNPMIELGGLVSLISEQNPTLNGLYKIITIGTNGESHGDSWYQHCKAVRAEGFKLL